MRCRRARPTSRWKMPKQRTSPTRRGTALDAAPHQRLRAVAVMFSIAVQVAVPTATGITRVDQLRGRRVDVGAAGRLGGARGARDPRQLRRRLRHHHRRRTAMRTHSNTSRTAPSTRDSSTPRSSTRSSPASAARWTSRAADRSFPRSARFRSAITSSSRRPFPPVPMRTRRATCRPSAWTCCCCAGRICPTPLVYDLTRTLFDAVPALEHAHEAASAIDPERGPTASIPLHPGAARYYREREILK